MQPNEPQEVFDATVETEKIENLAEISQKAIEDARIRAEHQNMVTANLVDDMISQKKKSFRRTVVLSVTSVVVLLVLAIVFFVYLRWYGAGAGVAILTFVVAQIWLSFFKKWEYNANCAEDFGEADYLQSLTQEEFATANCADSAQKTASEDAKDVVDSEESEEKPATKAGKQQNN